MYYKKKLNKIRSEWLDAIEDSIRSDTISARIYVEFKDAQIEIETADAGNTFELHIWTDNREEERILPNIEEYIINILPDWYATETRMEEEAKDWELQQEDLRRWLYTG